MNRPEDAGKHLLIGFNGLDSGQELKALITEYAIGGIVLFKRNAESFQQLRALIEEAQAISMEKWGRPLWVAIDQEGGPVQRLNRVFPDLPPARSLAEAGPGPLRLAVERAADEMASLGIGMNLAPVVDLAPEDGTQHFMGSRTLGSDPGLVADLGSLWAATLLENGILPTAKHFPGLRGAESDPHHFAPVIRHSSPGDLDRDLAPFRALIEAGIPCVMTSHALYPDLDPDWPATLSTRICRDLLRGDLNFRGVLLSDDLDMAAMADHFSPDDLVRRGLLASNDLLLVCQSTDNIEPIHRALERAIAEDPQVREAHANSLKRLAELPYFKT